MTLTLQLRAGPIMAPAGLPRTAGMQLIGRSVHRMQLCTWVAAVLIDFQMDVDILPGLHGIGPGRDLTFHLLHLG